MRLTRHALLVLLTSVPTGARATEYRFCVWCDNHVAQTVVHSGVPDLGKEWYRVKTAMMFAKAYGAQGCSVGDFAPQQCGSLAEETLVYTSVSGEQIEALLSGNPVVIAQTFVEVVTGLPAAVIRWVGNWFK